MSRVKGLAGETLAVKYLEKKGWEILARNFYSKSGELDIIALSDLNELVFCEVKTYANTSWVHPLEAITKSKQRHLIKTAQYYMLKANISDVVMRFDALIVDMDGSVEQYESIFGLSA